MACTRQRPGLPAPAFCLFLAVFALLGAGLAPAATTPPRTGQDAASYLQIAARFLQSGDLDRASAILEEAVASGQTSVEVWHTLADAYRLQGRLAAAVEAAEAALALDPSFAPGHVLMGDIFRAQGWLQAAHESYREAIRLDPAAPAARYRLVTCLAELGQLRAAERECRGFLAAQETARLYLVLGDVLERQERSQEAMAAYDRAVELEPRSADAHSRRAGLLCRLGQYEAATQAARAALAIDPEHPEAHGWLGLAKAHRQDYLGAYGHAVKAEQAGLDMSAVWTVLRRRN